MTLTYIGNKIDSIDYRFIRLDFIISTVYSYTISSSVQTLQTLDDFLQQSTDHKHNPIIMSPCSITLAMIRADYKPVDKI